MASRAHPISSVARRVAASSNRLGSSRRRMAGRRSVCHFPTHGPNSDPSSIVASQQRHGACVIEKFITKDQVQGLNDDIRAAMEEVRVGRRDVNNDLRDFHGVKTKRLSNLIPISRTWREEVIDNGLMHNICGIALSEISGDYWLSTAQVIDVGPGSPAQPLHLDAGQWWPMWEMPPSCPEMMLNFLIALDDTTAENGATRVIRDSHTWEYAGMSPGTTPALWRDADAVPVELSAGDCLLLGGRTVHQAGSNMTANSRRRVLTVTVCSSCFTPEEASPLLVDRKLAKGLRERTKKFLGFRSMMPSGSIGIWTEHTDDLAGKIGV